jgi:hypothetical protein
VQSENPPSTKQNRWLAQVSIVERSMFPKPIAWTTFEIQPDPLVQIEVEGFRLIGGRETQRARL